MKNFPMTVFLACACLFNSGGGTRCTAQPAGVKVEPSLQKILDEAASDQNFQANPEFKGAITEAATQALQSMGPKATAALAHYIVITLPELQKTNLSSETRTKYLRRLAKTAMILGTIGAPVAKDASACKMLLTTASFSMEAKDGGDPDPNVMLMRLAAIEALGKVHEHRGALLTVKRIDESGAFSRASQAAGTVEEIAVAVFQDLAKNRPADKKDGKYDERFETAFRELLKARPTIIKTAAQVKKLPDATSSVPDEKGLEASLRTIHLSYLKATTAAHGGDADKGKTDWHKKSEGAYELLNEARSLEVQLRSLQEEIQEIDDERIRLSDIVAGLTAVSRRIVPGKETDEILPEVAFALNRIFSAPAAKPAPAEAVKKDTKKKKK